MEGLCVSIGNTQSGPIVTTKVTIQFHADVMISPSTPLDSTQFRLQEAPLRKEARHALHDIADSNISNVTAALALVTLLLHLRKQRYWCT
jgi:hypothetical protein